VCVFYYIVINISIDPLRTVYAGEGIAVAFVGSNASFVIEGLDAENVSVGRGGEQWRVLLEGPLDPTCRTCPAPTVDAVVTDLDNGTYVASYALPGPAGVRWQLYVIYVEGSYGTLTANYSVAVLVRGA
jgi:hypothetical protein